MTQLQQQSGSSPVVGWLDIDLRDLPKLWWTILRITINDYLQLDESNENFTLAQDWLFCEHYDKKLDGDNLENTTDIVSFHVISRAFNIDKCLLRCYLTYLRDASIIYRMTGEETGILTVFKNKIKCTSKKRGSYLKDKGLRFLLDRCSFDLGENTCEQSEITR